jgi:hypothetical protein
LQSAIRCGEPEKIAEKMGLGAYVKQAAISIGLYRPARLLHRALVRSEREDFRAGVAFYGQFVRPGNLCFDIGANIGTKTEMLLALGAKVVSIEPQPDLVREVRARGRYYGITKHRD